MGCIVNLKIIREATKSFTRDVNLPEYSGTRTGEKRIISREMYGYYNNLN